MQKTVIITGTSSGIGKETALYFHNKGWNVVATMRNPEKRDTELHKIKGIDLAHLDVLDIQSIRDVIRTAKRKHGMINTIINNAGYAVMGLFEESTREQAERQFNTNVFGLLDIIREIVPVFRKQKFGAIINVSSVGGRIGFPLYSLYQGTKWAVEGFSESLHYELRPLNIRVKIIEPGLIKTEFDKSSMEVVDTDMDDYSRFSKRVFKNNKNLYGMASHPRVVAKTIYRAAKSKSWKLRYSTGSMAGLLFTLRKFLPDRILFILIRLFMT
jgi:short-subunit dehydrogenase